MDDADVSVAALTKPRILLVKDEVTPRGHLARALSDEYVVDTAGNGREALSAVMRAAPILIVTDIVMPDIDGIEFLKAVRSTRNTQMIPLLLISGHAVDEQRIEGFKEGADAYLAKPYTERELRACIGSMLQSSRRRDEGARCACSARWHSRLFLLSPGDGLRYAPIRRPRDLLHISATSPTAKKSRSDCGRPIVAKASF